MRQRMLIIRPRHWCQGGRVRSRVGATIIMDFINF
ncbi:unnamed protein product [Brassica rapa subsp. trilocularis]